MKLYFRQKGDTSLPPLILLHGLWGASDNWLGIADLLSEHFHVILPDLRNHGNSPHHPEHDYPTLCQDIEEFIKQLHLPLRPFLVGHSMGGKILMHLLLKKPEIAKKAAIIDICPKTYKTSFSALHKRLLKTILEFPLHDYKSRKEIHAALSEQLKFPEVYQILFKNIRKGTAGFEWKINAQAIQNHLQILTTWTLCENQHPYLSPILFIRGSLSDYITDVDIPCIHSFFPAATITTISQATHQLHIEQAVQLSQILIDYFLQPSNE